MSRQFKLVAERFAAQLTLDIVSRFQVTHNVRLLRERFPTNVAAVHANATMGVLVYVAICFLCERFRTKMTLEGIWPFVEDTYVLLTNKAMYSPLKRLRGQKKHTCTEVFVVHVHKWQTALSVF